MKKFKLYLLLLMVFLGTAGLPQKVSAAGTGAVSYNESDHDYIRYCPRVTRSYLYESGPNSSTRVEAIENKVVVETYQNFKYQSGREIPMELPIFGGFYVGKDYNYLFFGQENPSEQDNTEVIRVVKYAKDWKRLGQASLFGANTTIPFRSGKLDCTEQGGMLYVRTSHQMYQNYDGLKHQANLSFIVNESSMQVTSSYYGIYNISNGYVSHSFNQFIRMDDNRLIALDHGDAHPRSLVLIRYQGADSVNSRCSNAELMKFPGQSGDNFTGTQAGGFEISPSHYLTAGNSVYRPGYPDTANIFLIRTEKSVWEKGEDAISTVWFTGYQKKDNISVGNPHFLQITDHSYLLLWEERNQVSSHVQTAYCFLDGEGNRSSDIKRFEGNLSDCEPAVIGNEVCWYVTKNSSPEFYRIRTDGSQVVVPTKTVDIKDASVSAVPAQAYTGKQVKPSVQVTINGKKLIINKEVTVSYKNNVYPGQASITIQGLESAGYTGTKTAGFRIRASVKKASGLKQVKNGTGYITLKWPRVSGANGYVIYRSPAGSNQYKKSAVIKNGKTTRFTDKKLKPGTVYKYRIRSYRTINKVNYYGASSGTLTAGTKLPKANLVRAKSLKKKQAVLYWKKTKGAGGYEICRAAGKNGKYRKIAAIRSPKTLKYTDKSGKSRRTYYYKVRAYKITNGKKLYGDWSKVRAVRIK